MSKAIAIFAGGITELRQAAVREDGKMFWRMQTRHPMYGYRWSAWRATGETLGENAIANLDQIELGFATLHRASPNSCNLNQAALFNARGEIRARLP